MALINFFRDNSNILISIIMLSAGLIIHHFNYEEYLNSNNNNNEIVFFIYAILISIIVLMLFYLISRMFKFKLLMAPKSIQFITPKEYDNITKLTTEQEKEKLYLNEKFQKMLEEKGSNESNWNWQLRDRFKGRMNVISDDELNVDVSSDELEHEESHRIFSYKI